MMIEPDILTEVPETLKRLARLVVRGFFSMEHAIIIDLLVRNPCMKEDDIAELLKFDKKQLRALLNTLKNEKFTKVRMKVETDQDGKTTRHNYYFINYQVFVNVVKYKLDHIRRKIEMEERDNTSRASFRCPSCEKTYTDLEVDQLFDMMSGTFVCSFCQSEVEEDQSAVASIEARTLLAKFNEQIQPLYDLLRECDDIKLAPELMEPEPTDIRHIQSKNTGTRESRQTNDTERSTWSGDATRNVGFGLNDLQNSVTISVNEEEETDGKAGRERPVWMVESTVHTETAKDNDIINFREDVAGPSKGGNAQATNEIETLLIIHEKKGAGLPPSANIPGASESDSSDSETESPKKVANQTAAAMDSEEDDSVPVVMVAGVKYPINEITDELAAKMTSKEKDKYIRLAQEMYEDMYE